MRHMRRKADDSSGASGDRWSCFPAASYEMMAQLITAGEGLAAGAWDAALAWFRAASADAPIEFVEDALALPGHPYHEQAVRIVRGAYASRRT